jgi:hypothetical protein
MDEMNGEELMSPDRLAFFKNISAGEGFARRMLYK